MLTDERYRHLHVNWHEVVEHMVATFHYRYAEHAGDPRYDELISRLVAFDAFADAWSRYALRPLIPLDMIIRVDSVEKTFALTKLQGTRSLNDSILTVIFHTPRDAR